MLLVNAHVDNELDPFNAAAVAKEIAADPALRASAERIEKLQRTLREIFPAEPPPASLERSIRSAIEPSGRALSQTWSRIAASILLTMIVAAGAAFLLRSSSQDRVAEAVLDSHMRALLTGQVAMVASSDRHTVKPWFNGRIAQSPAVVDLAKDGYPLAGARIDVVETEPVATIVYNRRAHVISLLAVPGGASRGIAARAAVKGFNVVSWSDGSYEYWAVSDLNAAELIAFAKLLNAATNPAAPSS